MASLVSGQPWTSASADDNSTAVAAANAAAEDAAEFTTGEQASLLALATHVLSRVAVSSNGTVTANTVEAVDTTSGTITRTLPAAPAAGTLVAIKHVIQGSTNTVVVNRGGSDLFNKAGGSTSLTLSLGANQGIVLHYDATAQLWTVIADDVPVSLLDARYPKLSTTSVVPSANLKRRAPTFGNMVAVTTRPAHGLSGQSDGTNLWGNSRIKQVAPCDISNVALTYCNFQNGGVNGPSNITVRAAVEYNSVMVAVFFRGSRNQTIEPGATIVSDLVGINIPKGATYWIRTNVLVASTAKWPHMMTSRSADGEGSTRGSSGNTDSTLSGTITATSEGVYTAQAVLTNVPSSGNVPIDLPVIGGLGDSIVYGLGEISPETDLGFFNRALDAATPYPMARVKMDRSGSSIQTFLVPTGSGGHQHRLPLLEACTSVVEEFGINDLNSGGRTLSQLQADKLTLAFWIMQRGIRLFWTTLTPWTTSTDGWTTVGNQTVLSFETTRTSFNDWVRDGAPIDATTLAAVATGTSSNVLRMGQTGHPVYSYFDLADTAESARNSGKWKSPGHTGTINTTNASPTVTVASGSFPTNGEVLFASGIPVGDAIASGGGTSTLTLSFQNTGTSSNATATASGVTAATAYTSDGVHPAPAMAALYAAAVDLSKLV